MTTLSAGDDHACAVTPSGEARCWGDNSNRDHGGRLKETRTTPTPVKDVAGAIAIRTGEEFGLRDPEGREAVLLGRRQIGVVPFLEGVVDVAVRRRMLRGAPFRGMSVRRAGVEQRRRGACTRSRARRSTTRSPSRAGASTRARCERQRGGRVLGGPGGDRERR